MFPGYYGYGVRHGNQRPRFNNQTNAGFNPQWRIARGTIISSLNNFDVFRGNEILEVSVVDASLMDAPSTVLGQQQIRLQAGQRFPIRFQFYYDKSRAAAGHGSRVMQAGITDPYGQLMYINDTHTEFKDKVKIDVRRV